METLLTHKVVVPKIGDGKGLTVMVKLCGIPGHPLAVGVTVIVAVTAADPGLLATKAAMFPEPEAASPIPGVLLVQL